MSKTYYQIYSKFNRDDGNAEDSNRGMFYGTEDEVKEYLRILADEYVDKEGLSAEEIKEDFETELEDLDYEETSPVYQFKDGKFIPLV